MRNLNKLVLASILTGCFLLLGSTVAQAVSQWSRQYKWSCQTCHSAFPRLNYFGERFFKNGFQDPDLPEPDGGTQGKMSLNENTQIGLLSNFLGIRLNLTPVHIQTNSLTVGEEQKTKLTIGETNWFQLFVAGAINRNLSIFIEAEYDQDHFHFSWYYLGFHNLAGPAMNFQVGNLSPLDFASYANRLRQMGPVTGDIFGVKSSAGGQPEDAMNMSGSRHGIQYYGYTGPLTWWAGASPGSFAADVNEELNFWAGLKGEVTEAMGSPLEGSSVTLWFYQGTDAAGTSGPDSLHFTNNFTRFSPQLNLRYRDFDVQAAYVIASEDNWKLDATDTEVNFSGITVVGGYMYNKWYPVLQFDDITSDDAPSLEKRYLTASLSYLWRENIRYGIYSRFDLKEEEGGYQKQNAYYINIRMMF